MAGITVGTMSTTNATQTTKSRGKGLQVSMQGRSTKTLATFRVSQPCLRSATKDPDTGLWKDSGSVLTGDDAASIISKYLKANQERRLAKFEQDLKILAIGASYETDTRALNGKSVTERATEYLHGKIYQALDACPQMFTVDNTQYRLDSISMEKYIAPADALAVIKGQKAIGGGTTVQLQDEAPAVVKHFIDEDTFAKANLLMKEILKPAIKGNTLTLNGKDCITFTDSATTLSGIEVGSTSFDESKYTLF